MGIATAVGLRKQIVREKQGGKSLVQLSKELELSYSTVYNIWRLYREQGEVGLVPKYSNCGPQGIKSCPIIYRVSIWLKRQHPNWGAPYIRTILEDRYPAKKIASIRTLQVWYKKAGLSEPKQRMPAVKPIAVKAVHDCWQIDAKENIDLADGSKACYLTTVDVKSGSVLATPIFFTGEDKAGTT